MMRTLFTILLGLIFFPIFAAQFALLSTTDLLRDGDTLAKTLKRGQARTLALDAIGEALKRELRSSPDPAFARLALARARTLLEGVMSDAWVSSTVKGAHRALVRYLETGDDQTLVSLGAIKGRVRRLLDDLGRSTLVNCRPGKPCFAPAGAGGALFAKFRAEVGRVLSRIPDELTVDWLIRASGARSHADREDIHAARLVLAKADRFRWAGALVLPFLLGLIALINRSDLARVLVAMGLVVALSSGLYLGIQLAYGGVARERVAEALDRGLRHHGDSPAARRAARQVILAGVDAAATGYRGVVAGCLGLGLLLIGGAITAEVVAQRRRRRDRGAAQG